MDFMENKKIIRAFVETTRPCEEIEIAEASPNVLCLSFGDRLDFFINKNGEVQHEGIYLFMAYETREFVDNLLKFLKKLN